MRKALLFILILTTFVTVNAQRNYHRHYNYSGLNSTVSSNIRFQNSYTRNNGTYVRGHYKTMPDETNHNNYSTSGNRNPYTGSNGHRARDYSSESLNYGSGKQIYTGPKGGQYYYNSKWHKTYVPKR
jgi:hypothetical protein